jgi:hypothetical protein
MTTSFFWCEVEEWSNFCVKTESSPSKKTNLFLLILVKFKAVSGFLKLKYFCFFQDSFGLNYLLRILSLKVKFLFSLLFCRKGFVLRKLLQEFQLALFFLILWELVSAWTYFSSSLMFIFLTKAVNST